MRQLVAIYSITNIDDYIIKN